MCMRAFVCMYVCVGERASLRKLVKFLALRQSLDLNLVILYIQSVKFLFAHMYVMKHAPTHTHLGTYRHTGVCVCLTPRT